MAVERTTLYLSKPEQPPIVEIGYYASSLAFVQYDDKAVGQIIRGHWSAIENGTHYRRDMTFGEDACRVRHRQGAEALATLRNLANGMYELALAGGRTRANSLNAWCEQQTFSSAWKAINR